MHKRLAPAMSSLTEVSWAADPQPINVLGNYTQNAGGTLQLNIAGPASGQFDVLNVAGNAALNGTLRLLNLGYQPQNGDKLRLITTGGVITGRFAQLQIRLPSRLALIRST